jgi:nucleotide-binding universal stress UspA family protein
VDLEQRERALDAWQWNSAKRVWTSNLFHHRQGVSGDCQNSQEREVDVITMATHGSKGLSHLVFGSTAEKVVRLAPVG